ncbi:hypothetical protein LCGC14_1847100, partial [marine sediment metagenome]
MEKCDICGRECKTGQGLGGHKRWVHGVAQSSAQLRLEQPNPLITKSVLEQVLDERFAVIAEQIDMLSDEQPAALSSEQLEQLEQILDKRYVVIAKPVDAVIAKPVTAEQVDMVTAEQVDMVTAEQVDAVTALEKVIEEIPEQVQTAVQEGMDNRGLTMTDWKGFLNHKKDCPE